MDLPKWTRRQLEALDRAPFGRLLVLGLLLGGLGMAVLYSSQGILVVAGLVVVGAVVLAWSSGPAVEWEPEAPLVPATPPYIEPFSMVDIPGGRFLMGSPETEEGRYDRELLHEVTVSAFRMMTTPATVSLYREIVAPEEDGSQEEDTHPVTKISWLDAVNFCNALSEREGLPACYEIDGDAVEWIRDAGGYRLPTEAEWEHACRAGTTTRFWSGDTDEDLDRVGWYLGNSGWKLHPVAQKPANPWGLHDMHGNVLEWCWDQWGDYDTNAPPDPRGADKGDGRVLRGGSFGFEPRGARSACRFSYWPTVRFVNVGFRCVRRPVRES
jgi:formylglycine-generating enzyme required for sulfatase activity